MFIQPVMKATLPVPVRLVDNRATSRWVVSMAASIRNEAFSCFVLNWVFAVNLDTHAIECLRPEENGKHRHTFVVLEAVYLVLSCS